MTGSKRRLALSGIAALCLDAAAGAAAWWWLDGRWYEATDDAYVQGNLVQLTPQLAGDAVVDLDPADTQTALDEAKAALAQTVRGVRQLYANTGALRATVEQRRAELRRAQEDLKRRSALPDPRALAEEDMKHAQAQAESAAAALQAAEQQLAASAALVSRTTVATPPDVRQAAGKLAEAYLAAQRASIVAPVTGYVA